MGFPDGRLNLWGFQMVGCLGDVWDACKGLWVSRTYVRPLFPVMFVAQRSCLPSACRFIVAGSSLKEAVVAGSAKPFDFPAEYGLTSEQVLEEIVGAAQYNDMPMLRKYFFCNPPKAPPTSCVSGCAVFLLIHEQCVSSFSCLL